MNNLSINYTAFYVIVVIVIVIEVSLSYNYIAISKVFSFNSLLIDVGS